MGCRFESDRADHTHQQFHIFGHYREGQEIGGKIKGGTFTNRLINGCDCIEQRKVTKKPFWHDGTTREARKTVRCYCSRGCVSVLGENYASATGSLTGK